MNTLFTLIYQWRYRLYHSVSLRSIYFLLLPPAVLNTDPDCGLFKQTTAK